MQPETNIKKARQSKSLWYTLLSAIGVLVAFLVADEDFKELIGASGIMVLFLIDKGIQAYLRTITTTKIGTKTEIEEKEKTQHQKNLDILNEPSQADDMYIIKEI